LSYTRVRRQIRRTGPSGTDGRPLRPTRQAVWGGLRRTYRWLRAPKYRNPDWVLFAEPDSDALVICCGSGKDRQ